MSETTDHGDNIANEIQGSDTYGADDHLTNADVWNILDNLHTHMMDTRDATDPIFKVLERTMKNLEKIDDDLPL